MNACKNTTDGAAQAFVGMMFRGLEDVAAQLDNGHGGKGVSKYHLKLVLKGKRPSESLLAQVREKFPQLLPPNGLPWNRADEKPPHAAGK